MPKFYLFKKQSDGQEILCDNKTNQKKKKGRVIMSQKPLPVCITMGKIRLSTVGQDHKFLTLDKIKAR